MFFQQLFQNRVMLVAVLAWVIAQALKVVFPLIISHKWEPSRFFGLGGMPSSHSAVVCGLFTSVGMIKGFDSPEFAVSFVLAAVVMVDAAGVRRSAGKQAKVLNSLITEIFDGDTINYEKLREALGHSPIEVLMGAILGIILALIIIR